MAVELASAYVSIIPTTKGIAAGLEKELVGPLNAAAKKAGDQAGATMKASLDKAGSTFTKLGVGALAVAGAIGVGLFKTGKAASDLGESINAVHVTFGKSAAGILKLGADAAQSIGLSNVAFNSLAVQFSNFAITVAGKGGDVVGVMKELTGRAGDFASVMNVEVKDAAILFQSGLAGETEPLRRYGIDLSAAAVKAFAAANGIGALGRELTESEKVTARYGLLMKSTAKDQGDFANTSDSAANSMRIAKAEIENASASIGASFAPAMAFAATKVSELVGGFANLNEATGGWLGKGAGIVAVALAVGGGLSFVVGQALKMQSRLGDLSKAFSTLHGRLVSTEGGLTRVGKGAVLAGTALGIAAIAAYSLAKNAQQDAESLADVAEAATELSRATDDQVMFLLGRAMLQGHLAGQDLAQTMALVAHTSIEGAKRALELAEAAGVEEKILVALRRAIVDEERASKQATVTTTEHGEALDDLPPALDAAAIGTDALKLATDGLAAAADEAKRKADAFADSLVRQRERTEELYGIERSAVQAKHDFADSTKRANDDLAALNETLKKHKVGSDEATSAVDTAAASILKASEDYATLNGATLNSDLATKRQIDSLRLQAEQLAPGNPLRARLLEYIAELARVQTDIQTRLTLNISMGQVSTKVGDIPIGLRFGTAATGGWRSGPTVVGEDGPELLDLPRNTYVHTAAATRSLMAGGLAGAGGGAVPPIVLHNYRRDIGVADMNQVLAMARLAS